MGFLKNFFGDSSQREIKRLQPVVDRILALEDTYRAMIAAMTEAMPVAVHVSPLVAVTGIRDGPARSTCVSSARGRKHAINAPTAMMMEMTCGVYVAAPFRYARANRGVAFPVFPTLLGFQVFSAFPVFPRLPVFPVFPWVSVVSVFLGFPTFPDSPQRSANPFQ